MNYLAHVLLGGPSEEGQIGGLLGDFVKGDPSGQFPPVMEREIRLHRKLDTFVDSHPAFRSARDFFPPDRRRFAGVVLDVCFDHALTLDWDRWCGTELRAYTRSFYGALERHRALLPENLLRILPSLVEKDWLASYQEFENVAYALERMAARRLRRGEGLAASVQDARDAYPRILATFDAIFPDLWHQAQTLRAQMDPPDPATTSRLDPNVL